VTTRFLHLGVSIDTFFLSQAGQKGCIDINRKNNGRSDLIAGGILLFLFCIWTYMIQNIDVRQAGVNNSDIGFAILGLIQ